jgi:N-methylhydantoinase B
LWQHRRQLILMRAPSKRAKFDPIDLEILWNQIITLIDETAYAVRRTSMSKVVVEGADFGVMLHDTKGRLVASDIAVAAKVSTVSILAERLLEHFPPHTLKPGDVLVSNNPWWLMGHLNDLAFLAPLFWRGKLVGFAETMAHMADIGGSLSARPRELFEEGIIVPPLKAVEAGRDNATFFELVRANVRVPQQVISDMRALITGCHVLEAKLGEFLAAHGLGALDPLADEIIARSDAAMRQSIRDSIPDGEYRGETSVDGFDEPLAIRVRATVKRGEVDLDFAGTSRQSEFGINCTDIYRHVWSTFTIKCLAAPDLPGNEGTFRPIRSHAPLGTLVSPKYPAPVKMKPATGHYIPIAILDAFRDVLPCKMLAESGKKSLLYLSGRRPDGSAFSDLTFVMGGIGARATKDGLHCTSFPGNAGAIPIEVLESVVPILVRHKHLRPDSGGPGRFRGGCGTDFEFESRAIAPLIVQAEHGKLDTPPKGLRGGGAGAGGSHLLNGRPIPDKQPVALRPGDVVRILTPGSGGMYPPADRDPAALAKDVANGIVTPAAAARDYGADPKLWAADAAA